MSTKDVIRMDKVESGRTLFEIAMILRLSD